MLILAGRLMTTTFVFITVVTIAHAIHVLLTVDHLLLVLDVKIKKKISLHE